MSDDETVRAQRNLIAADELELLFALKSQRETIEENKRLREACREAFLFMTAPANSPRLWAMSRGKLTKMLEAALGIDKDFRP